MTPRESAGPGPAAIAPELVELLSGNDVVAIAPALLGARLAVASPEGTVAVRLTEVEAYAGEIDPGSHAFRGRTARNSSMFEAAGRVYVYFTYGMHHCVNVVCGAEGVSRAVLLRAGEVVEGVHGGQVTSLLIAACARFTGAGGRMGMRRAAMRIAISI